MLQQFNGISTPHGLFNTEIWFIRKFFIVLITMFSIFYSIILKSHFLSIKICLHTFKWFQVFLLNIYNLYTILEFKVIIQIKG